MKNLSTALFGSEANPLLCVSTHEAHGFLFPPSPPIIPPRSEITPNSHPLTLPRCSHRGLTSKWNSGVGRRRPDSDRIDPHGKTELPQDHRSFPTRDRRWTIFPDCLVFWGLLFRKWVESYGKGDDYSLMVRKSSVMLAFIHSPLQRCDSLHSLAYFCECTRAEFTVFVLSTPGSSFTHIWRLKALTFFDSCSVSWGSFES